MSPKIMINHGEIMAIVGKYDKKACHCSASVLKRVAALENYNWWVGKFERFLETIGTEPVKRRKMKGKRGGEHREQNDKFN